MLRQAQHERNVWAIVAAGGIGKRLGLKRHKSFAALRGRPMLAWVLSAFEHSREIGQVVVVAHRKDLAAARRLVKSGRFRKVAQVVEGGDSRMASVWRGVQALPSAVKWVLVHDAARPLVTPEIIRACVRGARGAGAAIAAVPVVPTIKQARAGWVVKTLDRKQLWVVQTPQVFERRLLEQAHRRGMRSGFCATDDSALVEALGKRVRIIPGPESNIKVTTPEDLMIAEALIRKGRK